MAFHAQLALASSKIVDALKHLHEGLRQLNDIPELDPSHAIIMKGLLNNIANHPWSSSFHAAAQPTHTATAAMAAAAGTMAEMQADGTAAATAAPLPVGGGKLVQDVPEAVSLPNKAPGSPVVPPGGKWAGRWVEVTPLKPILLSELLTTKRCNDNM